MLALMLLSLRPEGVFAKDKNFEEISYNHISGTLENVPLGIVLEELQQNLKFEFFVPEEELDQPIFVELSGEPIGEALAKILSSWDYAIQTDDRGTIQRVYVVKKASQDLIEKEKQARKPSTHDRSDERDSQHVTLETEEVFQKENISQSSDFSETDVPFSPPRSVETEQKLADMLTPPGSNPSMVITPTSELPPMVISPPSDTPEMTIISASEYPPMEIFPVSEADRQAFRKPTDPSLGIDESQDLP